MAPHDPTGEFTALTPARILDTREGLGRPGTDPLGSGSSLTVQVAGQGGVPSGGAAAVVLNATVVDATAPSYLTIWPNGTPRPTISNLNYGPGDTVPNLVTVALPANGRLDVYNNSGTAHVVFDVVGFYATAAGQAGARYEAVTPFRFFDTRDGSGGVGAAPVGPGATLDFKVTGVGGVPATGVSGVVMNVTVTEPTASGHLTVYPGGGSRPLASNLNFTPGITRPNLVTMRVPASGVVSFYNSAGHTHLLADVVGYYLDGQGIATDEGRFVPLPPQRIRDTRSSTPYIGEISVSVGGEGGVPASAVDAAVMNVTVTEPTGPGHLTAYPREACDRPLASNLNFVAGQTVPNLVISGVAKFVPSCPTRAGSRGIVSMYASATTHIVVDVFGYFTDTNYTWDATYGGDGFADLGGNVEEARVVKAYDDGSILLGLDVGETWTLRRLLPTGAVDQVFAANTPVFNHWNIRTEIDASGRVLVAEIRDESVTITRIKADGGIDTSFSGDGRVAISRPAGYAAGLTTDSQGRVAVIYEVDTGYPTWTCHVTRFLANGSVDSGFGGGAPVNLELPYSPGSGPACFRLIPRQGGGLLAIDEDAGIVELTNSGAVDPNGPGDGFEFLFDDQMLGDIFPTPDGKFYVGASGNFYPNGIVVQIARLLPDGQFDPTFGTDGIDQVGFGNMHFPECQVPDGNDDVFQGLTFAPDGSITALSQNCVGLGLARWRADGQRDPTFGSNGRIILLEDVLPDPHEFVNQTNGGVINGLAPDGTLYMVAGIGDFRNPPFSVVRFSTS